MAETLEPPINESALPRSAIKARQTADDAHAASKKHIADVEAHVAVYRDALHRLGMVFETLLDTTDVDLDADTRWSALWKIACRSISLSQCLLVQVEAGFGVEAFPTARAINEANRWIFVFLQPRSDTDDLLRRWLAGKTPKPRSVRSTLSRAYRQEHGAAWPSEEEELYSTLSAGGHVTRDAVDMSLSVERRQVAIGPSRDWLTRMYYVGWAGEVVEETVMSVGKVASTLFLDAGLGYQDVVDTIQSRFQGVRRRHAVPGARAQPL